jgi:predicted small lipoprotein YifL
MILVLTCALACATLVGCGQTGELTLPDKEGEVVSKGPDAAATTPEATDAAEAEAARKREAAVPTPAPK